MQTKRLSNGEFYDTIIFSSFYPKHYTVLSVTNGTAKHTLNNV